MDTFSVDIHQLSLAFYIAGKIKIIACLGYIFDLSVLSSILQDVWHLCRQYMQRLLSSTATL